MRNYILPFALLAPLAAACGDDDAIGSDEEARRAYLGLDLSIEKALNLGFDGYNAASSANIDPQVTTGEATGELTVTGQVSQSSSDNHEMRLYIGMVDYSEGPFTVVVVDDEGNESEVEVDLTYDTSEVQAEQPYLHLSLRNLPEGTFTGELTTGASGAGRYYVTGDIEGEVELNLTMEGQITAGDVAGAVVRVPGSTTITGTATSGDGVYDVDVTL